MKTPRGLKTKGTPPPQDELPAQDELPPSGIKERLYERGNDMLHSLYKTGSALRDDPWHYLWANKKKIAVSAGMLAYAGLQIHMTIEHGTRVFHTEDMRLLANALAQDKLSLTLQLPSGAEIDLNNESEATKSQLFDVVTKAPYDAKLTLKISTGRGRPICDLPLTREEILPLFSGRLEPKLAEYAKENTKTLASLCSMTEEQMRSLTKDVFAQAYEPGPYSVVAKNGSVMEQRVVEPTLTTQRIS